jgi:hypothetical protein
MSPKTKPAAMSAPEVAPMAVRSLVRVSIIPVSAVNKDPISSFSRSNALPCAAQPSNAREKGWL